MYAYWYSKNMSNIWPCVILNVFSFLSYIYSCLLPIVTHLAIPSLSIMVTYWATLLLTYMYREPSYLKHMHTMCGPIQVRYKKARFSNGFITTPETSLKCTSLYGMLMCLCSCTTRMNCMQGYLVSLLSLPVQ